MTKNMIRARGIIIIQRIGSNIKVKKKIYHTMTRNGQGLTLESPLNLNGRRNFKRLNSILVAPKIKQKWEQTILLRISRRKAVRAIKSSLVPRRNMIYSRASYQSLPPQMSRILVNNILGHLLAFWNVLNGFQMQKNARLQISKISKHRVQ